jgi:hypothetical protein
MAVIMAVAVIMVVVMMTFAGKEHRQEEHQTADKRGGPGVTQSMGREKRIEGDVAGKSPGTEVVGENPKTLEAAVVRAALDVDGQEASEEDGRDD